MRQKGVALAEGGLVNGLVYADDTLLIDVDAAVVKSCMDCIRDAGQQSRLSFNWSKIKAIPVRAEAAIRKPDGTDVRTREHMTYLGSLLSTAGRITSELGRRIGQDNADFDTLRQVWSHSTLSTSKNRNL